MVPASSSLGDFRLWVIFVRILNRSLEGTEPPHPGLRLVDLTMQVKGKRPISHLIAALTDIDGVLHVGSASDDTELE
jgi:hypothetical protein